MSLKILQMLPLGFLRLQRDSVMIYAIKKLLLLGLLAFLSGSCSKSSCQKEPLAPIKTEEDHKEETGIVSFPGLNLSGLSPDQEKGLIKLFNDEVCPCACPKTFAQCINLAQGCQPGRILAQWSADQLKAGVPERLLFQGLSEEINSGYLADPLKVKLDGAYQKGPKNAAITIVEFADFECPACKVAFKAIKELLADSKDIQLYFMHFPLSAHPNAEKAAVAAEAAGKLGKFWDMHDELFSYQGALSEEVIHKLAQKIFNKSQLKQFEQELNNQELLNKVRANREHAMTELKLLGTPTILFNARPYNLSLNKDGLMLRVAMEKARSSINCQ